MMRVLEHGKVVAEIPNAALTDDAPLYQASAGALGAAGPARDSRQRITLGQKAEFSAESETLAGQPEHLLQALGISAVRLHGADQHGGRTGLRGRSDSHQGHQPRLAMALDGNSRWCYLDPKLGAMHAVAESARNVACTGATPIAATNCLNFGNPEKPHIMWQFSQTIDGLTKACEELETPITGGNVSFYNETLGEGIYPTPVMGVVGIMEDVHKAMGPHFREAGRALMVIRGSEPGDASDVEAEFGSSEYAKEILGTVLGIPACAGIGQGSGAAESHRPDHR